MEKHSSLWAYFTGIGTAFVGGITLEQAAMWVGILTALGTFIVNWYYKAKEDNREEKLRKAILHE